MSIEENKAIALRFLRSLETSPDFNLLADDLDWWIQGKGSITLLELRAVVERAATIKSPSHMVIRHITAEDDRVAIECNGQGGRLRDGRAYENSYHFLFFLRDGRISAVREHFDTAYAQDVFAAPA